jgi:outer membrane protein OmpA-like peptidoglycan-associated protein
VALAGELRAPLGDEVAWLGDPGVRGGLRLVAGAGDRTRVSTSVGARLSAPAWLPPDTLWGPRLTWGVAASRTLPRGLTVLAEADGEAGLGLDARSVLPVEARGGAMWRPDAASPWTVTLAAGGGLTSGIGAPDARVLGRLAWAPAPAPPARAARLHVVVVDEAGTPVDAVVRLRAPSTTNRADLTGSDGDLTVRVDAGDHMVSAWAEGLQPARAGVTVLEGATAEVRLVLAPSRVSVTAERLELRDKVYFELDSAILSAESFRILDDVAATLENHAELVRVEVQGHTDDQGEDAYNLALSQRRAEAVRAYLIAQGVPQERLTARGFGETLPLQPGSSEDARDVNRRVAFMIVERTGIAGR